MPLSNNLSAITFILVHSATTYIDTSLKVISVKSKQALVREINGLPSQIIRQSSYPVSRNKNEDVSVNTTMSQRDMNTRSFLCTREQLVLDNALNGEMCKIVKKNGQDYLAFILMPGLYTIRLQIIVLLNALYLRKRHLALDFQPQFNLVFLNT